MPFTGNPYLTFALKIILVCLHFNAKKIVICIPLDQNPTKAPSNQPTYFPTNQPTTAKPSKNPTPKPTSGGTVCCAERNQGYQVCKNNAWCNANPTNCGNCGGSILSVPLQRTGCCSWGGNDCSGIDPMANAGCNFLQSDCEGSCGGNWQSI